MPKWDALSPWALFRKPRPGLGLKPGCSFRNATQAESVSRILASEWDAVSATPL